MGYTTKFSGQINLSRKLTMADAHAHLLRKTQRELDAARMALARAQGRHGNVKGMRPNA